MVHRARVVARLTAVLSTAVLVLSGPGAAAASAASSVAPDVRDSFGPSWIIGDRTSTPATAASDTAAQDAVDAPPASVSSGWPKGRLEGLEGAEDVLGYLLGDTPSAEAEEDVPGIVQRLYVEAAANCEGLPWAVLAGIGEVASDHGRDLGTRLERASGPLRFPAALWREHGVDADGDGRARRTVAVDAFTSAAYYLCDTAAGEDGTLDLDLLRESIARFFADADAVEPVLASALAYVDPERSVTEEIAAAPDTAVEAPETAVVPETATAPTAEQPAPSSDVAVGDVEALIDNPNITWTNRERDDIRQGLIDGRVTGLLAALARDHEITVVVLKTGHSRYIAGTRKDSHHYHGRAVDITHIDGEKVSVNSEKAYALALWLDALPASLRPAEVGSPFANLEPRPGFFTDSMHTGHLHIGWRAR